jgi:hypothetical protein
VRALPDDVTGVEALELGCDAGYVSACLARLGASPDLINWDVTATAPPLDTSMDIGERRIRDVLLPREFGRGPPREARPVGDRAGPARR